ncbi:methionyl-tRNA formyltransferase [Actinokineospora globicatena]|uniref:Methionyl-tRNA formyltransferase n=1 Tax=Actinokineospora globicatena TaxID=103729 RepID=A0A9W6V7R4_9PSEU|nr:methionyl-tRNA formyltransferase [Actinokineospora globicatena]MCP2300860.1 methionyl-tRNA formyltransferase [Actinokineospora globicatena]GLW77515.1 methionyl-tRNA formyltransferase [Actinokineospora globicatena]GLW84349.1 methionyl-tRNA formyltransferase [Actinokineospora globicatena]GLW93065.1 methionyl-tRNA formyltransferase [Actinokineospora globicatena]
MRVVMFGFQTWGHRTLEALLASHHDVVAVVTHPPGEGVYEKVWSDSVAELAEANGVEVIVRERPDDDELFERLTELDPDVVVATNWRTWIPPRIFGLPKRGTLNVHDSLLPAYAGFSPLIWALINDEPEVGVTAHMMDDTLDAGPIVLQRAVPVGPRDTSADLFAKTLALFGPITVDGLAEIEAGRTDFAVQDRTNASFFHKRAEEDLRVDWTWSAQELDRLVRAQSAPYPSAFCFHRGKRLEIVAARVSEAKYGGTPGRIFYREGDGVAIVAGPEARRGRNHALLVTRVRTADGTELAAHDYFKHMGGYLTSRP